MVQILREQTRNYVADQSSAIRTAQMAQNVNEWSDAIRGAANVYSAFQKGAEAREAERAKADENVINTAYGKSAHNATVGQLDVLAEQYGADTPKFKEAAYALAEKNYSPQIEGLQTEAGKISMQTKLRNTKDYIDTYQNTAVAKKIKEEKARVAAASLARDIGSEAYNQGATKNYTPIEGKAEYVKFVAKDKNISPEQASAYIDRTVAEARLRGLIDSDPVSAAMALGDEDIIRDAYLIRHPEDEGHPTKIDKNTSDAQLKEVLGEDFIATMKDAYGEMLSAKKQELEMQLKKENASSPVARKIKQDIKDIDKKLSKPDEGDILDVIRDEFNSYNGGELKKSLEKSYNEFKQDIKVDAYNNEVRTYNTALDTDVESAKRAQTEIWLAQNGLLPMTPIESKMMSSFSDEVPQKELYDSYHEWLDNSSKVKTQLHEDYEGTMEMHDLVQKMFEPGLTPLQRTKRGYDVLNAAAHAPLTDAQMQNTQSLVAKILKDQAYGDLVSSVLGSVDRAWFDSDFVGGAFVSPEFGTIPQMLLPTDASAKEALPKGREYRTTKSAVERMIQNEAQKAVNNAMTGVVAAYYLPENQRTAELQKWQDYLTNEKVRIYNKAMKEYGIDLNYLDNELKTRGQAFAQVGGIMREYKGRDSELKAIWADVKRSPIQDKRLDALMASIQIPSGKKE